MSWFSRLRSKKGLITNWSRVSTRVHGLLNHACGGELEGGGAGGSTVRGFSSCSDVLAINLNQRKMVLPVVKALISWLVLGHVAATPSIGERMRPESHNSSSTRNLSRRPILGSAPRIFVFDSLRQPFILAAQVQLTLRSFPYPSCH